MAEANSRAEVLPPPRSEDDLGAPEEFRWQEPGFQNEGMPAEQLSMVADLVTMGNRAFRADEFSKIELAITCYSRALLQKPGDPVILGNRSAAFCRISRHLTNRSASESEYRPLNGLDPTTYAELALKDAEKVVALQKNSARSFFLKGIALKLLERYNEARETILSGLQIDPLCYSLQKSLRDLDKILGDMVKRAKHEVLQRSDDFECTLCFKLLYEPVTTPCGHSFCRSCLFQSMDHGNKCPMCRTVIFISPRTYPISVTMNNIIQKNFPEEYAERKAEHDGVTNLGVDIMPLFVMDVVLPYQKLPLNIFEPRYRLMVRRAMEGNHRIGMAAIDPATGLLADFACEVEITECEPLPDGRFYIEVEGRRRFQILRSWDQDGYRVAEVEWVRDNCPLEGTPEREDLKQLANAAAEMVQTSMGYANDSARNERRSRRVGQIQAAGMPSPNDPELFSFWLVSLLKLRQHEKLELLRMRETRERISRGLIFLKDEVHGCSVQ